MSEENVENVSEQVSETSAVSLEDFNSLQEQFDSLKSEHVELVEKLRIAEENKTRANQESAERRVTLKSQQEVIDALQQENRQMWLGEYVRRACDDVGVPLELAGDWIRKNIEITDFADGQAVADRLGAKAAEFAEKFPQVVAKVEPKKPDPWGTPEQADGDGSPVHDVQRELERVMREEPENLDAKMAELGYNELLEQGAFV